jgi:antitoxin (DNA-binding transcriptional repressor) of toxin-antitoxin stability system
MKEGSFAPGNDLDIICDQSYSVVMKKMAAAKFKEQCLSVLDHLDPDGVLITKHGRPVARVLPAERASADLIGSLRGRVSVKGDVQSTGLTWDAHD